MVSFNRPNPNDLMVASDLEQLIDAWQGAIGKGVPLSATATSDPTAFAAAFRNIDSANSRALIVYKADGTVLLQIDKNGVIASPDGTPAVPLLTLASVAALFGPRSPFAPAMFQNVALTLTSAVGFYRQIGKSVTGTVDIGIGSAGSSGGPILLSGLPVNSLQRGSGGRGWYLRSGVGFTPLTGVWVAPTQMKFYPATLNAADAWGVNPAFAAGTNDALHFDFDYEAA